MRKTILTILSGMLASAALAAPAGDDRALAIHQRVLTLDSHVDIIAPNNPARLYLPDGTLRSDLPKLIKGGLDAIVYCVTAFPGHDDPAGVAEARKEADYKLGWIKTLVKDNPDKIGLAFSADDVARLHRQGKISVLIAFQNARSIGSDITQIDALYKQGVRIFSFNHAGHNAFSDSSRPWQEPLHRNNGLSPLGKDAVKRLNDLGVLIDVSQLSTESLFQTVALSRAPVVATHSAARALFDHIRNLSDAELDAIRSKGGVVQVVPFGQYLKPEDAEAARKLDAIAEKYGLKATPDAPYAGDKFYTLPKEQQNKIMQEAAQIPVSQPTLRDYVDHIDYIARRIGWDHVGIGSDFNQGGGVTGFDSEADAPNVTRELVRRGYTEKQIAGIWGGNFLRVLRAAEAARAQ
ncbi:MAG TPA: dipeptidase [Sphingobium sp.]|nr:dipeptidase [Sphingobium sp.]